jgi:hypothetical protein
MEAGWQLLEDVQTLLQMHLQLLALEARRAAWGLVAIAAFSAAVGLLLALTCLGLTTALALWLMEQGMRPSLSVLVSSLLNLAGVLTFVNAIQREARVLGFPATRNRLRKLMGRPADSP